MNAHNCRKTAMLSRLFLFYKLLQVADDKDKVRAAITQTFTTFATHYLELTSSVTDLISYVPMLTDDNRASIMAHLTEVA